MANSSLSFLQNSKSSATPFFADKKTSLWVVGGVIALHAVAGYALINMTMPKVTPPKVTPPLEISFVTPPPQAIEPNIETQPKPKNIPSVVPKIEPTAQAKTEPNIEKSSEKPMEKKTEPVKSQMVTKPEIQPKTEPLVEKKPEPTLAKKPEINPNILIAQQRAKDNERAEQIHQQQLAQEKLNQENLTKQAEQARQNEINRQNELAKQQEAKQLETKRQQALADEQARAKKQAEADTENRRIEAENARQKALAEAQAKAKQQADDRARKEKEALAKKSAESNTPVTFSIGQASWRNRPNFSCSDSNGEALTATVRYSVDKQGNLTGTALSKPSGNAKVDRMLLQQARSARFNPFTKDGVPVMGVVNVPIRCQ